MAKKKPDMSNWQCRLRRCSSVGKFTVVKITSKGDYYTKCNACGLDNVFDKQ